MIGSHCIQGWNFYFEFGSNADEGRRFGTRHTWMEAASIWSVPEGWSIDESRFQLRCRELRESRHRWGDTSKLLSGAKSIRCRI